MLTFLPASSSGRANLNGESNLCSFRQVTKQRIPLEVERLEQRTLLSWATLPGLTTPRGELAATMGTDGRIYVVGGTNRSPGGNPETAGDTLEAYYPASNSWTTLASMSAKREFLGVATGPDGRIYAIGGFDPNTLQEVTTAEAYSPSTNTWTAVASPPLLNGFGLGPTVAVAGKDGRIYAFCHRYNASGVDIGGFVSDSPSDSWTTGTAVNIDNSGPTAATLGGDGRIYVLGGFTYPLGPGTSPSPKVEAYDPATNTWASIPDDPVAQPLGGMAQGPDGRIYVMGGEDPNGSVMANVNVYDPHTNTWSTADNLPTAREELAAVASPDGHIYAIGGSTFGEFRTGIVGVTASGEVDILTAPSHAMPPVLVTGHATQTHTKIVTGDPAAHQTVVTSIPSVLPSLPPSDSGKPANFIGLLTSGPLTGIRPLIPNHGFGDVGARLLSSEILQRVADSVVAPLAANLMTQGRISQQLLDLLSGTNESYSLPSDPNAGSNSAEFLASVLDPSDKLGVGLAGDERPAR
jgi:N-acetylneuraminic acid mutarotase